MSASNSGDLTKLLAQARDGDREAASAVFESVYSELRRIANQQLVRERSGHTLQPTAIVNEAWLKMLGSDDRLNLPDLESRSHFYALAARVMRQILVDHARGKQRAKRDGGRVRITINVHHSVGGPQEPDVLDVDEALKRLAAVQPRQAQVAELRYFAGCTIPETAAALEVSQGTVKNDWVFAQTWLKRELKDYDRERLS